MARIQYTSETSRIMRTDSAMMDVDASGCFDRIVPRLPTILNQANGSPQASASCRLDPTKSPITLHMGKTLNNERENKNKQRKHGHPPLQEKMTAPSWTTSETESKNQKEHQETTAKLQYGTSMPAGCI